MQPKLDNVEHQIQLARVSTALLTDTATERYSVVAEQIMDSDTFVVYVFDATRYIPVALGIPYVSKSANYTLLLGDGLIECTSGSFTLSLPTAVGIVGRSFRIKNSGSGTVTVSPDGSETIDGLSDILLEQYDAVSITSNNLNWIIV